MAKLVAFLGPAGVGKDEGANHLVQTHHFVKMSLADEMKRFCKRVYDFSDWQLWGPSSARNEPDKRYPNGSGHLSPRVALQMLGTEWGRVCYQNTWVDLTLRDAKKVMAGGYLYSPQVGVFEDYDSDLGEVPYSVIIPDCRFRNEVDAIHQAGGIVIRLKRQTKTDALTIGVAGHASEAEQLSLPDSLFDYILEVQNGIGNYHNQLDNLLKEMP